jgi:hypothetical protein
MFSLATIGLGGRGYGVSYGQDRYASQVQLTEKSSSSSIQAHVLVVVVVHHGQE